VNARLGQLPLRLLAWLGLQWNLLLLGVMSAGWNLLALLLYPLLPRPQGVRLGRLMISRGYRWFWALERASGMLRLDASALDGLRDEPGLLVVANHPSMLDAVMLVARLPRSFCIMKSSLLRNPLLGPGARLARYVRNDTALGMITHAVQELRAGGQLVLFPEGTRTTKAPVNPLHASFALIAKRARVPVQVAFIDTDSPYLGKGWPLWRLPPLPICFSVRLGPRLQPSNDVKAMVDALQACFERELGGNAALVQADAAHAGPGSTSAPDKTSPIPPHG
jgi:1-acyl-sn-glycerol-3-phosphate acyltransferase